MREKEKERLFEYEDAAKRGERERDLSVVILFWNTKLLEYNLNIAK